LVSMLLAAGADIEAIDKVCVPRLSLRVNHLQGRTPLLIACQRNEMAIVSLLLGAGAKTWQGDSVSPIRLIDAQVRGIVYSVGDSVLANQGVSHISSVVYNSTP
jgi:ankyrin repeat protein